MFNYENITNMVSKKEIESYEKLPDSKKVIRLKRAISELQKTGEYQLGLLTKYHKSNSVKEIGFHYFFTTLKSLWEQVSFAVHLGKGKYKHLSFFPTRLLLENVFRLEFYINQKLKQQNEICFWEMARVMKRYYDEFGDDVFAKNYKKLVEDIGDKEYIYPDISEGGAYKDPFPHIEKLIFSSKLPGVKGFYTHYRFLSELEHGKLVSLHMSKESHSQYRRCLLYVFILCRWLLLLVDSHIKHETKDVVKLSIEKANSIVFAEQTI